ncbi:hypothetical protein H8356DRAFT_1741443 [Neocallimastix lanati (nom. inval.)]|nr:hypothetical protein H8356DRAFT_1741443 [Neocallimastix sp. JGI-2020a]
METLFLYLLKISVNVEEKKSISIKDIILSLRNLKDDELEQKFFEYLYELIIYL